MYGTALGSLAFSRHLSRKHVYRIVKYWLVKYSRLSVDALHCTCFSRAWFMTTCGQWILERKRSLLGMVWCRQYLDFLIVSPYKLSPTSRQSQKQKASGELVKSCLEPDMSVRYFVFLWRIALVLLLFQEESQTFGVVTLRHDVVDPSTGKTKTRRASASTRVRSLHLQIVGVAVKQVLQPRAAFFWKRIWIPKLGAVLTRSLRFRAGWHVHEEPAA